MALRRAISTAGRLSTSAVVGPRAARTALPVRGGGGHGDHIEAFDPPYARLPKTSAPLHEQDELMWNDGVSPETTIDFDVPHYSKVKGLLMWLGGFGFFGSVFLYAKSTNHPSNRGALERDLPESTMTTSLGAYPHGKY